MKKFAIILMIGFVTLGSSYAKSGDNDKICKAIKGYKMALKSENPGLRLNALYQIAQVKSMYPNMDLSECTKEIKTLLEDEKNLRVNIQGNLTLIYLKNDGLVKKVKMEYKEPPVNFFKRVYEEINSVQLAVN